jgi:glutamine synthetase
MEAVVERLDQIGVAWEAWTGEAAPGQTELNLAPTTSLAVADNWARTRQIMREVGFERGHTVSFMAKPTAGFGGDYRPRSFAMIVFMTSLVPP